MSHLSIEKVGRRLYVVGNSFAVKDCLKKIGCKWDADRKQWWIGSGKQAELEGCIGSASKEYKEPTPQELEKRRCDGKVEYKGKTYYVVGKSPAKGKLWLTVLDCSINFWALESDCKWVKRYGNEQHEQTVGSIRRFIDGKKRDEEAAKKAEVERKAASAKPIEQLLSEAGRTLRDDGAAKGYTRYLGRSQGDAADLPLPGEILTTKGGPCMIASVNPAYRMTDDDIEDRDAWHDYPQGPGWYVHYDAVPVSATESEIAAQQAKQEAAAKDKRRGEIIAAVQQGSNHSYNASTAGLTRLWGNARLAGSETLYGDESRLVYVTSSYDDGPHYWELADATLASEALSLRVE